MYNNSKIYNICLQLVGLKAELLRKQEEFKQERTQNKSSVIRGRQPPKFKKVNI